MNMEIEYYQEQIKYYGLIIEMAKRIRSVLGLEPTYDSFKLAVEQLNGELIHDKPKENTYLNSIEKSNHNCAFTMRVFKSTEDKMVYIIAHLMGHLFLHMGYAVDNEKWENTNSYLDAVYYQEDYHGKYTREEKEANIFAEVLLARRD